MLAPVFAKAKNAAGEEVEVREPLLFEHPATKMKYLRKRDGGGDTTVSPKTTTLSEARKLRDDYWAAILFRVADITEVGGGLFHD